MANIDKTRAIQLGMPWSTANNKLKKMILFKLLKESGLNWCFQCNEKIEKIEDLSIEHKIPWLYSDNPKELFFDLNNIAFSHINCNSGSARKFSKGKGRHPSNSAYNRGCRCPECIELHRLELEKFRRLK